MAPAALAARRHGATGSILPPRFYARETEIVARELLGCVLECRGAEGIASGRIVEPLSGVDLMWSRRCLAKRDRDLTSGPGKLCAALDWPLRWCVAGSPFLSRPAR